MKKDKQINEAINQVVDTLKFNGVTVESFDLSEKGVPQVSIMIDKQKQFRKLEDTLDLAYWSFWTLLYGSYDKEKSERLKLELNYRIKGESNET